jgi:hypothetical protein
MGREAMKIYATCIAAFAATLLFVSPPAIPAKDGARVGGDPAPIHAGSGAGPMGGGAPMEGIQSAVAGSVASGATSSSMVSGSAGSYQGGASGYQSAPILLNATSFGTVGNLYSWTNYYSYLVSSYDMTPSYFSRFYRNPEPLITPEIIKLTLREPLGLSKNILDSIDELETMLKDSDSRTVADRKALAAKSKQIRDLAKKIRRNQTLSAIDLRKEEKLYEKPEKASLDIEALNLLREMAVDLDRQLRNMYSESSTSTISVQSYQEHSLESLAKGIERVCKSIEVSANRI